jgi:hypothetical protein
MASTRPYIDLELLLSAKYDQKWEVLRPFIEHVYIGEDAKMAHVKDIVKTEFNFDANIDQYRYHINKKWGMKKALPSSKKRKAYDNIQGRDGPVSGVIHKGRDVNQKMKRFITEIKRRKLNDSVGNENQGQHREELGPTMSILTSKIFLSWNLPYGSMRHSTAIGLDHFSPFSPAASTPSDMAITAPSPNNARSPGQPSKISKALKQDKAIDRARMFFSGDMSGLIKSLNGEERRVASTWLYQFWFYSFKTAKYWGRGPRNWTAPLLGFDTFHDLSPASFVNSPSNVISPNNHTSPSITFVESPGSNHRADIPSKLCRWAIHVKPVSYTHIPSPPTETELFDAGNDNTMQDWPQQWRTSSYNQRLRDSLENNDFSNVHREDLPIAIPEMAKTATRSNADLLVEAVGFAIMGRNTDLLHDLFEQIDELRSTDIKIASLFPLHLAISYLDGSKACCDIVTLLLRELPLFRVTPAQAYTNELGHTVLDSLMVAILKSHTRCLPVVVDDAWKNETRFTGIEVDICGRWDADSECIRTRLARGNPEIPFGWKHKFCHTSVQVIVHAIRTLNYPDWAPSINSPSGLFLKYCSACGAKLQLQPLHSLVLTAFHLGQDGSEEEDLFGAIACLLCMIAEGADPGLPANISVAALLGQDVLGQDVPDVCDHMHLTPGQLALHITPFVQISWSKALMAGWNLLIYVLQSNFTETTAESLEEHGDDSDDDDMDCSSEPDLEGHSHPFGHNEDIATLWAAVQTEFLTYRRIEEADPWISEHFDMITLLRSLNSGNGVDIGLVKQDLMRRSFCRCGRFDWGGRFNATIEDVSATYFANLDRWDRATYLSTEMFAELAENCRYFEFGGTD